MATADAAGPRGPGAREEPQTQGGHQGGWREGGGGEGQALEEDPGALCLEEGSWEAVAGCLGTRLWLRTLLGVCWGRWFLNLPLKRWISSLILCSLPSPCLQEELKIL